MRTNWTGQPCFTVKTSAYASSEEPNVFSPSLPVNGAADVSVGPFPEHMAPAVAVMHCTCRTNPLISRQPRPLLDSQCTAYRS
ncbi:unnamed protein product [Chondrus crispus]|uniref:Uncharacterized protein n=1 Tax=Chondrus crispus TaxID=2769 RepID=R7QA27_CHOCR|nr:unnamed protein product [Chondrus crispus]CDF34325.1 unnamed protein product [Chondrus crispus]|eukprot:XP_005714144.1 unnamed protein product [Chondrus crispus]